MHVLRHRPGLRNQMPWYPGPGHLYLKTSQGDSNSRLLLRSTSLACKVLQFCFATEPYLLLPPNMPCFPAHGWLHLSLIYMFGPSRADWAEAHFQKLHKCQASCYSQCFCVSYSCWYHDQIKSGLLWNYIWISATLVEILIRQSHICHL